MNPSGLDPQIVQRFEADLARLMNPDARLGIAVSGGSDSLALLLLATAARRDFIEAATVDHALRPEGAAEAAFVADCCARLEVPHAILPVHWAAPPTSAIQDKARTARYELLETWARNRGLSALVTAHHREDQAETLLMRIVRGSGVRGLAGMRPKSQVPGSPGLPLLRPLLGWTKSELEAVCSSAGVVPIRDPSNDDPRFERVRIRQALASATWLNPDGPARSAACLAAADEALDWAADREWRESVTCDHDRTIYTPRAPAEVQRRVLARVLQHIGTEGGAGLRGRELDTLLETLHAGRSATLRGAHCTGGDSWVFTVAPPRRPTGWKPRP